MYIYFDESGTLKEIITESAFRNGDSKRDKIYVYWAGEHSIMSGWIKYRLPNGEETTETTFNTSVLVGKELPNKPLRNLKYFSYEHTYTDLLGTHVGYRFFEITIPDVVLNYNDDNTNIIPSDNNMIIARIRFVLNEGSNIDNDIDEDDEIKSLGAIVFSVEKSIGILTDNSINLTQYNYLLSLFSNVLTTFVTVDETEQTIEGVKTFTNGIEIGSTPIKLEEGSLGELVFDASIRPSTSNSKTLGYPSYVWNVVYANSLIDSNANALLFQSNLPKFKEQGNLTYSFMLNEKNETISGHKTFNNGLVVGASKDLVVAEGEIWSLNETLFAIGAYEETKTHYAFPQGGVRNNPHDYEHPLIIATEDYVSTYAYAKSYIDNNFVPIVEVTTSTQLVNLTGNPKILKIGSNYFIAKIIAQRLGITNTYNYYFEIENLIDKTRYVGAIEIGMAGLTLGDVMTSTYEKDYAVADNYYTKAQVDTKLTSMLVYKGTKTVAELNTLASSLGSAETGQFYNVSDSGILTAGNIEVFAGDNVAWTGSSWDKLTMDLSVYDDKFISAGFFEVQNYNTSTGEITFVYASDLYNMSYDTSSGILTIEAN